MVCSATATRPPRITSGGVTESALPVLCLGEALVDLIGRRPGDRLAEVAPFSAHPGGVAANVSVIAARAGAPVALAGGAGDDPWGRWLRDHLAAEGVGLAHFSLVSGLDTALAFVAVDADGEPTYSLRGETTGAVMTTLEGHVETAVAGAAALLITTNTLVGGPERAVTMRAREAALAARRPVIVDANLRLGRWPSATEAIDCARAVVSGALLVRANAEEVALITGERSPERAAAALHAAGAELVVITLGRHGALLRGGARADVPGVNAARVVNTAGAGDALTGTLLAHLARSAYRPEAVVGGLPDAVAAAAAACARWGAV
jgi:sugar/nucleoside kinase (ribokinase family)